MKTPTTKKRYLLSLLTLASGPLCFAQLVVDIDLGVLTEGTQQISGTTAATEIDPGPPPVIIGGRNNAQAYPGSNANTGLDWGNEIVYQFELQTSGQVQITTISVDGDPDFFLLSSLATEFDAALGKTVALDTLDGFFLDGAPPLTDTFLDSTPLDPGVYYLVIDSYQLGTDANFTIDLTVGDLPAPPPPPVLDTSPLGSIVEPNVAFALDTFGSDFDTEIGVYDATGNLIANNDDAIDLQSEVTFPVGLPAGSYRIAIGSYDTLFDPNFVVTSGAGGGNLVLNYPGGSRTGGFLGGTPVFFDFTVGAGGGGGPIGDGIEVTSIEFDPINQEFIVSWVSGLGGEFNAHIGTAADLSAASAGNGLMPLAVSEIISPAIIPVPPALQGSEKLFLQISQ